MLSILSITFCVLSMEAPGGRFAEKTIKPWSSVGIKPVGAFLIIQKVVSVMITRATIAIHLFFIKYFTLCPYLFVVARKPVLNPRNNLFINPVLCPSSV